MEGTNEPAACSFAEASAVDDSRALVAREQASDIYMYNYNMIEEFQQDGSAYTFKGSLVMGWVGGTSGTAGIAGVAGRAGCAASPRATGASGGRLRPSIAAAGSTGGGPCVAGV